MFADRRWLCGTVGPTVWFGVFAGLIGWPAGAQGIPEENQSSTFSFSLEDTILPGNFLPNPDMETPTRFEEHRDEAFNGNGFADYWHHSMHATWSNGTTDPVVSGERSLMLFDNESTGAGLFVQEEFRSFATEIPEDPDSPTGRAQKLYFRWHWNYEIFSGTEQTVTANIRLSNAPIFSLDLGPSLGDNKVFRSGSTDGEWEQVTVGIEIPDGAQSFDILFLTEGSKDVQATMFIDDVSVSAIAPTAALPGDADGDGDVDAFDLGLWQTQFGMTGDELSADFDTDGDVDAFDLGIWQINFGTGLNAAVPEPAAVVLFGLGASVLATRRRR